MWMKIWSFLMASLAGIFFATVAFPATFIPEVDPEDPNELPSFLVIAPSGNIDARIINWDPYRSRWVIEAWNHVETKSFKPNEISIYSVDGANIFIRNNKPYAELHEVRLNGPDRIKVVPITSVISGIIRIDDGTIENLMDRYGFPY